MKIVNRHIPLTLIVLLIVGQASAEEPYKPREKGSVTFSKDIAPIFQKSCQTCHHAGTSAPMSLMTYNDARPWARAIRDRVLRREMPPWHLDKTVGIRQYKNDISLNDDQIATIVK